MRNVLGYLVTVVAALCWGASGVSADYLMEHHGVELTLISFFRMFVRASSSSARPSPSPRTCGAWTALGPSKPR